jgi:hypothetical protein
MPISIALKSHVAGSAMSFHFYLLNQAAVTATRMFGLPAVILQGITSCDYCIM